MIYRHASGADIFYSFRRQEMDMRSGEHGCCNERDRAKGVRGLDGAKPSYSNTERKECIMSDKLSPQEEAVKWYLDRQAENDEFLRTLYVPSRIKDCFKYITGQARKMAVNGCAVVEDSVVFKWARDYYLEELPKEGKDGVSEVLEKNGNPSEEAYEDEYDEEDEEGGDVPEASVEEDERQMTFDF